MSAGTVHVWRVAMRMMQALRDGPPPPTAACAVHVMPRLTKLVWWSGY
jgi:hypothetical protein